MKNKELEAQIFAYNKAAAERKAKADDLDILVTEIRKLPPGQLKKILTDEVWAVLKKYGLEI